MAQSLSKILLHLVFSTKYRANIIPQEIEKELHAYLAASCRANGSNAFRVGGTANHVHIACTLPRTMTISKLLEEIKTSSSKWMKKQHIECKNFSWQTGYGAFSLGESQLETLIKYIDKQHEHHEKLNFKDEFRNFLQKYKMEYNEKYIWD